jgi:aspartate-semialdehyde dehydrogenase
LDERSFPATEVRLLDDEVVDGTLTEAAGEPAFIRSLAEDSFAGVELAFFAGRPEFTLHHWPEAVRAGATVVDLSGALVDVSDSRPWIPALDPILSPPSGGSAKLYFSPPAATLVACTLSAALAQFAARRLSLVFLQPVSERGQSGIEELEKQTVDLLSFQPVTQTVFDAQVAFNLLARFGRASLEELSVAREAISRGAARYLAGRVPIPAVQLLQAPVFYSYAFSAFVEFVAPRVAAELERAFAAAGVSVESPDDLPTSNVSVAGESRILLARIEPDPGVPSGFWLWGAADNVRLTADNALRIAEKLLAS